MALDPKLAFLVEEPPFVRGRQMVVRELLDPSHVLDEHLFRGRREESLELPLLSNRVDEVESAAEDREEAQERLPHDVVAHRTMDRLEPVRARSEEHTSELQSQSNLVCRLLL